MSDKNNNEKVNNNDNSPQLLQGEWLIRPCNVYDEEYSDCTSIKARFNQYFVFGKPIDCQQWKRDSDNCYRWIQKKDVKSAEELIESEKARRKQRLSPHYNNDVWKKRKSPPPDWNKPLPEYLQKEYENTYLNIKSKELKGEIPLSMDGPSFCSIM